MTGQQYTTHSLRRAAQFLLHGAIIERVRELEQLTSDTAKIVRDWQKQGKEGPIFEFTLTRVTPDMKKRVREMKYCREPLTDKELRWNKERLQRALLAKAEKHVEAGKFAAAVEIMPDKKVVKAAIEKVLVEILAIEKESWQLRSRMGRET